MAGWRNATRVVRPDKVDELRKYPSFEGWEPDIQVHC